MKKEIKVVNKEKGICQVTTVDERWYAEPSENPKTKLPEYRYVPSVTWICSYYPKGKGFWKWLADKGWDESERIKAEAGDKGSKVHKAIETLLSGETIEISSGFVNPSTGELEELTVEEYEAVLSFEEWYKATNPKILKTEISLFGKEYAGTIDLVAEINGEIWIIDLKTSQYVWASYELQVSAYRKLLEETEGIKATKLAILQIGYQRNKDRYKFNEVEDKYSVFRATMEVWKNETEGEKPLQRDYPVSISLQPKKVASKKTIKTHENV